MATFTIEQPHALSPADAKTRIDQTLTALAQKYGGRFSWQSETQARLEHKMAKAAVAIEPARVSVTIDGGFALGLIKGKVESRVKQELEKSLAS